MLRRLVIAFLPLALLIALPAALRPRPSKRVVDGEVDRLVIITPHNESIRYEFERAFARHYAETTGRQVVFDWRTPGGTSDATRFINDQFQIAFRRYWTGELEKEWTAAAKNFDNRKLKLDDPAVDPIARLAREEFLQSAVGIDVDIFFGGGQYDHSKQAQMGHAVDAGLQRLHPDWFGDDVIPQRFSGETFYDDQGRYYGACLAAFGICYNKDRIAELSEKTGRDCTPTRWEHLGEPVFFQHTAVADPTKSGSITKCFEMLIQQQMQIAVRAAGKEALGAGWTNGMNLIKRIGANARYLTDSASKVPRDVAQGNTTVGMCIDFYGRSQAQATARRTGGRERMAYITPTGGSSISADPIQLLRGAPNRDVAVKFIEFVLSEAGQKLWDYRLNTPGGPEKYVLRRLPVRRDMYAPEHRRYMADGDVDPFAAAAEFEYHGGWTGRYFGLIRVFIRCMVIDANEELKAAWAAIIAAGGPDRVPEAMARFNELPFSYAAAGKAAAALNADGSDESVLQVLRVQREWANFFRARYTVAKELAEAGR